MNIEKLKLAESEFFARYPGGFRNPEMMEISKKHKVDKMHQYAREILAEDQFGNVHTLIDNTVRLVSRASLVSVFEKPKFKDYMKSLEEHEKHQFADGLYQLIHGDMAIGYDKMLEILVPGQLAKWSIMTICSYYYSPTTEIFIKPTTAKGVINYFELAELTYKPRPTYAFYKAYKAEIISMAKKVDASLCPDYAAFSGFLMLTMH